MNIGILCGEKHVEIEVPDNAIVLNPNTADGLSDPEGAVAEAIARPIESAPLAELAAGRSNACIVISDVAM